MLMGKLRSPWQYRSRRNKWSSCPSQSRYEHRCAGLSTFPISAAL